MSFTSLGYAAAFPLVLLLYTLLPQKLRASLLLCASVLFYAAWDVRALLLLLLVILVTWGCGVGIARSDNKRVRLFLLLTALIVSLGVLGVFKYAGFFAESLSALVGLVSGTAPGWTLRLLLPVGISFYTFQALSYVLEVYRVRVDCEKNPFFYALYVCYFPQLVAGPIERPENLLPQLRACRRATAAEAREGLFLLLRGYVKKLVLADFLAPMVDRVYNAPGSAGMIAVVAATVFFALQIYCDFSGYTDIARGCSLLLGIRLSENFRLPYFAVSIRDFWRRWHITLTSWLTDYVYIPLGGSRKGRARHIVNILIVFFLSGLWHGASWHFAVWGLLHGLFLAAETLLGKKDHSRLLTLAAVLLSWVFFRAATLGDAWLMLGRLTVFDPASDLALLSLSWTDVLRIAASAGLVTLLDLTDEKRMTDMQSSLLTVLLTLTAVACAMLLANSGVANAFIYFQF